MFTYAKPEQKSALKSTVQKKDVKASELTDVKNGAKTQTENQLAFSFSNVQAYDNSYKVKNANKHKFTSESDSFLNKKNANNEVAQLMRPKKGFNPIKAAHKDGIPVRTVNHPVDSKLENHIFKGGTNTSGLPTGYHSKIDNSTTHEGFDATTPTGAKTYKQKVRLKTDKSKVKTEQSTFFPDTASKADIIEGIKYAPAFSSGVGEVTIASPPSVAEIKIRKSGETIYPVSG